MQVTILIDSEHLARAMMALDAGTVKATQAHAGDIANRYMATHAAFSAAWNAATEERIASPAARIRDAAPKLASALQELLRAYEDYKGYDAPPNWRAGDLAYQNARNILNIAGVV